MYPLFLQGCSLSVFYIKPQLERRVSAELPCCSLSVFYIKPQLFYVRYQILNSCSLSVFYIKPQHGRRIMVVSTVVPYQYSTSNRNLCYTPYRHPSVVPYQYSTSNRNSLSSDKERNKLFLISILHQTATSTTQPFTIQCCSLSVFYIKPQLQLAFLVICFVVPYQYSTSNRNYAVAEPRAAHRCSLSVFYIKPQLLGYSIYNQDVVPYQYSTSNRNSALL